MNALPIRPAMAALMLVMLTAAGIDAGPPPAATGSGPTRALPDLPPFLDVFLSQHNIIVVTAQAEWVSATGTHHSLLARPDDDERLPALLWIERDRATDFARRSVRELAGIGYVVLLVELKLGPDGAAEAGNKLNEGDQARHERLIAQLSAATRWLRRRQDVFPDRIAALGWGGAAQWALELAADQGLQTAVLGDSQLPLAVDAAIATGLRHTAVFVVRGMADASLSDAEHLARFKRSLDAARVDCQVMEFQAKSGFMDCERHDAFDAEQADRAWFEVYEFLGKHVEDAPLKQLLAAAGSPGDKEPARHFASIADLMRALNTPTAVRGQISQALRDEPRDEQDWQQLGARAALIADSGELLRDRRPAKGTLAAWQRHATAYRDAAAALANAADRRDYPAARKALDSLNATCAKCHLDFR